MLKNKQCWLSLNYLGKDRLNYVFSISLPNITATAKVISFFKKNAAPQTVSEKEYKSANLLEIGSGAGMIAVCIDKGVVSISDNEELLKTGDDQLTKENSLLGDSTFLRVM